MERSAEHATTSEAAAPALTADQRRRSLAAMAAHTYCVGFTLGLVIPLASLLLERQGISNTVIGLNTAMPGLAILAIGPFAGRLVPRLGMLPAIYGGLALAAAALALMAAFPTVGAWFALRFFYGAGLALPWVAVETWINSVATDRERSRAVALYSAALYAGIGSGPLAIELVGIEGLLPWALGVAALVLAAVFVALVRGLAPRLMPAPEARILQVVRFAPVLLGAALLGGFCESATYALFPLYGLEIGLGQGRAVAGLSVLVVGAIAFQWPLGWLADRMDRRRLLLALALAAAGTVALLPAATGAGALLWVLLAVLGGLLLGFYVLGLSALGARFQGQRLTMANAAFVVAYTVGEASGPVVVGFAMDLWRPHGFVAGIVGALLAFALLAALRFRAAGPETGQDA
ncbi:MAG: MFS transporter [Rhodovibrionaceae bacterium]|nr:MFS transporter [Rhodovibrionaceae bacterium]